MTVLDGLIFYLASLGKGSRQTFDRATRQVTIDSLGSSFAYMVALCARAFIEVDWNRSLDWSVPKTSIVAIPELASRAGTYLIVGPVTEQQLSWLKDMSLSIIPWQEKIGNLLLTRHSIVGDVGRVFRQVPYDDVPFYFDYHESLPPGERLLRAIPNISQLLRLADKRVGDSMLKFVDELAVFDADTLTFKAVDTRTVDLSQHRYYRSSFGYGRRRYFQRRGSMFFESSRDAIVWASIAASETNRLWARGSDLMVHHMAFLPVAVQRAIFLAGARQHQENHWNVFGPLESSMINTVSERLGIRELRRA